METIKEETLNCKNCDFACNSDTLLLVQMQKHKTNRVFSCEKCSFPANTMDELILDESVNHFDSIDVTVIEAAVDEIVNRHRGKRKNVKSWNISNINKIKYRIYD